MAQYQTPLDNLNTWRRYRGEVQPLTQAQADLYYRVGDYVPPAPPAAAIPPRPAPDRPQKIPYDAQKPKGADQEAFLSTVPVGFEIATKADPAQNANWRGTKLLGQGGYGVVGLWEYNNSPAAAAAPAETRIVVKQIRKDRMNPEDDEDLSLEGRTWKKLMKSNSVHIARMLGNSLYRADVAVEPGIDAAFNGKVIRLFMEYCPLGDLNQLLQRRRAMVKPFKEVTLWKILDCLIDGMSVLEYGRELTANPDGEFVPAAAPGMVVDKPWSNVVHFDLKPENVLLGARDPNHQVTPVSKRDYVNRYDARGITENQRGNGTPGYFAPEQFTQRWDYNDWQSLNDPVRRVAGNFGMKTNIWHIGIIMWKLVILARDDETPNHKAPFIPNWLFYDGSAAQSVVYGAELRNYSDNYVSPAAAAAAAAAGGGSGGGAGYTYTPKLIDTIFQCLYEIPAHRPSLGALKKRVYEVFADNGTGNGSFLDPEPWADFLGPEPPVVLPGGGVGGGVRRGRGAGVRGGGGRGRGRIGLRMGPGGRLVLNHGAGAGAGGGGEGAVGAANAGGQGQGAAALAIANANAIIAGQGAGGGQANANANANANTAAQGQGGAGGVGVGGPLGILPPGGRGAGAGVGRGQAAGRGGGPLKIVPPGGRARGAAGAGIGAGRGQAAGIGGGPLIIVPPGGRGRGTVGAGVGAGIGQAAGIGGSPLVIVPPGARGRGAAGAGVAGPVVGAGGRGRGRGRGRGAGVAPHLGPPPVLIAGGGGVVGGQGGQAAPGRRNPARQARFAGNYRIPR